MLIGKSAQFSFIRSSLGKDRLENDGVFKQRARSLAVPGTTITDPSTPASAIGRQFSRQSQYRLPSQYTPSVKSTNLCDIIFHIYSRLGEGTYLPTCLPTCLPICLSAYLFTCLPVYLFTYGTPFLELLPDSLMFSKYTNHSRSISQTSPSSTISRIFAPMENSKCSSAFAGVISKTCFRKITSATDLTQICANLTGFRGSWVRCLRHSIIFIAMA